MGTFHPFLRLPTELRLQIWDLTITPHTVSIYALEPLSPAPMRACAEARAQYRESYTAATFLDPARPLWVHFGLDTIAASHYDVRHFALATLVAVRRLRLAVEEDEMQDFYFVTTSTLRPDLMRAIEVVTVVVVTDIDYVDEHEWTDDIKETLRMDKCIQIYTEFEKREDDTGYTIKWKR
ncbi:hypothetical protein PG989_005791 [Apiospora arundinis]